MADGYAERSWTSADGLTLYYRDYPGPDGYDGPPVVCLHGLTRNARDFANLAEHISASRRVIVPDMRGRGQSEYAPDPASYNGQQYAEDLTELLSDLEIDMFISVGTSMGALITMIFAAIHPGRLAAVVMNDIGPQIEQAGIRRIAGYVGQGKSYPTWMHAAKSLQSVHGEAFPDFDLEQWLDMAKRTLVIGQNGRISYDYDIAIAEPFKQADNAAPAELWPAYDALRGVPMVLLRGELSDLLSPQTVSQMAQRNPAMTSVTIARVGHAPTLDEPQARAAIDALLAQV